MMYGRRDETSAEATARPIPDGERRCTIRALKSWNNAREDDDIPNLTDLTVEADMANEQDVFTEDQFLIMFEAHTSNSVVIFYGGELPKLRIRRNLENSMQQTLPKALKKTFQDACMEAVSISDVVYRHGMITASSGNSVLYRSIFMPLRSDSQPDRIYVFGAFSNEQGGTELLAAA